MMEGDRQTPTRRTSEGSVPRSITGRDQNAFFENRFCDNNSNNSNSKPMMCRDNLNNNAISLACRKTELDSLSQSLTAANQIPYRNRVHETDSKNSNIITIVENTIDFEKSESNSANSSSNASFQEIQDKDGGDVSQDNDTGSKTKSPEIKEDSATPEVTTNDKPAENGTAEPPTFGCPMQNQVFQTLKGIQQLRHAALYRDLTVVVAGQEFKCHKFVLANSSPYFQTLIDNKEFKDKGQGKSVGDLCELKDDEENLNNISNNNCGSNDNNNNNRGSQNGEEFGNDLIVRSKLDELDIDDKVTDDKTKTSIKLKSESETGKEVLNKIETQMKKDNLNLLTLDNLTPGIFEKILDFAYCVFDDVINAENALELLLAADRLKMNLLSQTCASYIAQTMSPSNVFDVLRLYDAGCTGLLDQRVLWKSHQVLRENFLDLSTSEDFLCLGGLHVRSLVEDSMLHVPGEMQVLQALLRWVKYKPEHRIADMSLMLQHIRFPLMTSHDLDKVVENAALRDSKLVKALVKESRFYSSLDYTSQLNWPRQNCISRRLFPTRDFILWTADRDKGLHFYSIIDGDHHKVTSFSNSRLAVAGTPLVFDSTASVCCYEDKIYFSGGEFMTDKLWSVDSVSGQVTVLAQMPRGRKYHSMVATRGCIYCLGGQDKRGYTVLDCVDCYVISKDTWIKAGKLAEPAYNMAAVVYDREKRPSNSGGAIYLLGGEDHSGKPLRLIQCFEWLPPRLYSAFKVGVSGMPPSLFSARAVTSGLDSLIYVVCGDGEVYKFEPDKSSLNHVATIKNLSDNPRQRFGLSHIGGRLIVLGGHQLGHAAQEPIKAVCLDLATKQEVKDFAPLLPGDNVNNCIAAKLSTNTLRLFL